MAVHSALYHVKDFDGLEAGKQGRMYIHMRTYTHTHTNKHTQRTLFNYTDFKSVA